MKRKLNVILMLAVLGLGGCTTTLGVYEVEKTQTVWKPGIIKGQTLDIYVDRNSSRGAIADDIAAWEKTQLFTRVSATRIDEPTKDGYFLKMTCKHERWEDSYLGFAHGFLWLTTVGLMPAIREDKVESCQMDMYENAIEIASTTVYLSHDMMSNGWLVIAYILDGKQLNKSHQETSAAIRVNKMLTSLSTMGEYK